MLTVFRQTCVALMTMPGCRGAEGRQNLRLSMGELSHLLQVHLQQGSGHLEILVESGC